MSWACGSFLSKGGEGPRQNQLVVLGPWGEGFCGKIKIFICSQAWCLVKLELRVWWAEREELRLCSSLSALENKDMLSPGVFPWKTGRLVNSWVNHPTWNTAGQFVPSKDCKCPEAEAMQMTFSEFPVSLSVSVSEFLSLSPSDFHPSFSSEKGLLNSERPKGARDCGWLSQVNLDRALRLQIQKGWWNQLLPRRMTDKLLSPCYVWSDVFYCLKNVIHKPNLISSYVCSFLTLLSA